MVTKFSEERIRNSAQVYRVFRDSVIKERGVYSKGLYDEGLIGSREDANRLLTALKDQNILKKGERTRAQYYEPDWSGITFFISEELSVDTELPESFIKKFVSGYVEVKEDSSLSQMFLEDLVTSIRMFERKEKELPSFLSNFLSDLGREGEKFDSRPDDLVEYAIESETAVAEDVHFLDWLSDKND